MIDAALNQQDTGQFHFWTHASLSPRPNVKLQSARPHSPERSAPFAPANAPKPAPISLLDARFALPASKSEIAALQTAFSGMVCPTWAGGSLSEWLDPCAHPCSLATQSHRQGKGARPLTRTSALAHLTDQSSPGWHKTESGPLTRPGQPGPPAPQPEQAYGPPSAEPTAARPAA